METNITCLVRLAVYAAVLACVFAQNPANAALTLTLTPANSNLLSGDSTTLTAKLTNTGSDSVSLLGTSGSTNGADPTTFTIDASNFEGNLPFTLAAFEAYTGTIVANFATNAPVGDYSLDYGVDGQGTSLYHAEDLAKFHVGAIPVVVPESATLPLFAALIVPAFMLRRKR